MTTPIVPLLGAALFEAGSLDSDPAFLDPLLGLLTRATEGIPVTLDLEVGGLTLNGVAVHPDLPGCQVVAAALTAHGTTRLQLPGGMEPRHWRDVIQLYASASGNYPTSEKLRAALRTTLPLAEAWGSKDLPDIAPLGDNPRDSATWPTQDESELTTRGGELGAFSAELANLEAAGREAADQGDAAEFARVLVRFGNLSATQDASHAVILSKERRRILSPASIEWLIREAANPKTPIVVAEALATIGADALEPLLEAIAVSVQTGEREALISVAARLPKLESLLIGVLRNTKAIPLLKGAATVAGRRHLEGMVTPLAALLRHQDAAVRTSAWHALEEIGTKESLDALSPRSR